MKTAIILTLLLVPALSQADDWTKEDTIREVAYLALHVADWGQTRNIANRGNIYHEVNPILGRNPSIKKVDSYFALTAIAHVIVSYSLPRGWRDAFQYSTAGFEAGVAMKNNSIGLKVDFK